MNFKIESIQLLSEMAKMLELDGANPFKVRAFQNAIPALEAYDGNIEAAIADKSLLKLQGIGKGIFALLEEKLDQGKVEDYSLLKAKFSPDFLALLDIQGLGAKKLASLRKELHIENKQDLREACEQDKIAALKGFGPKSQEKILQGLEHLDRFSGLFLYNELQQLVFDILLQVKLAPYCERIEVAGSFRRRKELMHDLDFVVATKDPKQMGNFLKELDLFSSEIALGESKVSLRTPQGLQVDFRLIAPKDFAAAHHHFTGSKEHNVLLRSLAKKQALKINEYGIFDEDGQLMHRAENEKELFAFFDLPFIAPELREGMGELEEALPQLIERSNICGLVHNHSTFSDGKNTLEEMAQAAANMGMKYFGISDHSQSAIYAGGMKEKDILAQHAEIDELNARYENIRILKGIEVDILQDGSLDYSDDILAQFEFVIVSIHSHFHMSEEEMTARILKAMSHPLVDILAHPTGRLLKRREAYPLNVEAIINAAKEYGVALEINSNPRRLDLDWRYVKKARDKGVFFVLSPDAHNVDQLANIHFGVNIARKGWLEKEHVLNCLGASSLLAHFQKMRQKRSS